MARKNQMPERLMIGTRIRERRVLSGIRQSELAKQAGISPSYLNLIEHNRRRIAGRTLLKLAGILGVDAAALSEGAETALLGALREAAARPAPAPLPGVAAPASEGQDGASDDPAPELDRIEEFAGRFPGWARQLAGLHRRAEGLERTVEALTDRLAHDPHLAD